MLIRGPSGSGKSDLALRLITTEVAPLGRGLLCGDDQVQLEADVGAGAGTVSARAVAALNGMLEVRGVGIVTVPTALRGTRTTLGLVVDLLAGVAEPERMPAPAAVSLLGVPIPRLTLVAARASSVAAVHAALWQVRSQLRAADT